MQSVDLAKYEANTYGSTKRSIVYNSYKQLEEEAGKGHGAIKYIGCKSHDVGDDLIT